jgi:hypothetical protein
MTCLIQTCQALFESIRIAAAESNLSANHSNQTQQASRFEPLLQSRQAPKRKIREQQRDGIVTRFIEACQALFAESEGPSKASQLIPPRLPGPRLMCGEQFFSAAKPTTVAQYLRAQQEPY